MNEFRLVISRCLDGPSVCTRYFPTSTGFLLLNCEGRFRVELDYSIPLFFCLLYSIIQSVLQWSFQSFSRRLEQINVTYVVNDLIDEWTWRLVWVLREIYLRTHHGVPQEVARWFWHLHRPACGVCCHDPLRTSLGVLLGQLLIRLFLPEHLIDLEVVKTCVFFVVRLVVSMNGMNGLDPQCCCSLPWISDDMRPRGWLCVNEYLLQLLYRSSASSSCPLLLNGSEQIRV